MSNTKLEEDYLNLLNAVARSCEFDLDNTILKLYDRHLCKYGYEQICLALEHILVNRKSRDQFPSVAEIIKFIDPEVSDKSMADEVANRILNTFKRWSTRYCKDDRFIEWYVEHNGELAWAVVDKMGGYMAIYNEWNGTRNMGTFRAQLRDQAKSVIELSKAGQLYTPPALPGATNKKLKELVGKTVKTISGGRDDNKGTK